VSRDDAAFSDNSETLYVSVGEFVVKEKMSVLHLKEQLLAKWDSLVASAAAPLPARPATLHHRRVRDGKTGQPSGPLRDDRVLGRCLLGLADDRKIVLQVFIIITTFLANCVIVCSSGVASSRNNWWRRCLHFC
jgi:hypothetical protein